MRVDVGGRQVELTPTEFQLLVALARRPGRILTRSQLLDAVHGVAFESYERAIDTHVKNLRRKLEPDPRRAALRPDGPRRRLPLRRRPRCLRVAAGDRRHAGGRRGGRPTRPGRPWGRTAGRPGMAGATGPRPALGCIFGAFVILALFGAANVVFARLLAGGRGRGHRHAVGPGLRARRPRAPARADGPRAGLPALRRPRRRLVEAARRVEAGAYDARVPVPDARPARASRPVAGVQHDGRRASRPTSSDDATSSPTSGTSCGHRSP